jgi:Fe-Mn family superoxide dismutase
MKLTLEKLNYKYSDLSPVMSEATLKYHRDKLAKGYVDRFNSEEGDSDFNEAGAFLHNIFFPQFKASSGANRPKGISLAFIEENWEDFDSLKEEIKKVAMGIQGSGWVYLAKDGTIKTIKNHQIKKDIVLLIDWWEHAWALDYEHDKAKYLNNIWKIIDWNVINDRLNLIPKKSRLSSLTYFNKAASTKATLDDVLDIKTNFKEADFWIWRKYNPGKPTKEFNKEAIGIRVKDEYLDAILPQYLYYLFEYQYSVGFWKPLTVGSVIDGIRVSDVKRIPISFLSPKG